MTPTTHAPAAATRSEQIAGDAWCSLCKQQHVSKAVRYWRGPGKFKRGTAHVVLCMACVENVPDVAARVAAYLPRGAP